MTHAIRFQASLPWPLQEVARGLRALVWTFPRPGDEPPTPGRVVADIHVPLGNSAEVSHRAVVDVGALEPGPDRCTMPVRISMGRRYPSFDGSFEGRDVLGETELTLVGDYRLPLGIAGQASGVAGGNGLAQASLRRFFETAVAAIKADLQATAPAWRPAARPESLRDT